MGRAIGSVVVGYIVMAVMVFAAFTVAYLLMGADRAYQVGTYDVSGLWIAVSIVLSFCAALIGGRTAAAIARSATPPKVLAGIVLVLGLVMAYSDSRGRAPESTVRTGAPSFMDAAQASRQPTWLLYLNPLIGAVGVLLGAAGARRQEPIG